MFFIDIAVPRDVDAELNDVDGVFVYDIDDFSRLSLRILPIARRKPSKPRTSSRSKSSVLPNGMHTLDVVPTILSLQEYLENIRQAEIDRHRSRFGEISPAGSRDRQDDTRDDQQDHAYSDRGSEDGGKRARATTVVDVIRKVFNLPEKAKGNSAGGNGGEN